MSHAVYLITIGIGLAVGIGALLYEQFVSKHYENKHRYRNDDCTICFEMVIPAQKKTLKCGHIFHLECIQKWSLSNNKTNKSCPNCRSKF